MVPGWYIPGCLLLPGWYIHGCASCYPGGYHAGCVPPYYAGWVPCWVCTPLPYYPGYTSWYTPLLHGPASTDHGILMRSDEALGSGLGYPLGGEPLRVLRSSFLLGLMGTLRADPSASLRINYERSDRRRYFPTDLP